MIAQILDIYPLFFFLFSTSPFPHLSISVHLHLFSSLFCQTGASFSILCSITDVCVCVWVWGGLLDGT